MLIFFSPFDAKCLSHINLTLSYGDALVTLIMRVSQIRLNNNTKSTYACLIQHKEVIDEASDDNMLNA